MDIKEKLFRDSWYRCWVEIGAKEVSDDLMWKLIKAYHESHRKYHTEQHLIECLLLAEQYRHLAVEPGEVEIALWFHDAVYDFKNRDNEEKSADWAIQEMDKVGIASERIERVRKNILATSHAFIPSTLDEKLVVDIDLSILGQNPIHFKEYENKIREEYSWVSEYTFCKKRWEILANFLTRSPLYHIPELQKLFEVQARINLVNSLRLLSGF